MCQEAQKYMAVKEKELSELQTKMRELGRKETELRNEKVSVSHSFILIRHLTIHSAG